MPLGFTPASEATTPADDMMNAAVTVNESRAPSLRGAGRGAEAGGVQAVQPVHSPFQYRCCWDANHGSGYQPAAGIVAGASGSVTNLSMIFAVVPVEIGRAHV